MRRCWWWRKSAALTLWLLDALQQSVFCCEDLGRQPWSLVCERPLFVNKSPANHCRRVCSCVLINVDGRVWSSSCVSSSATMAYKTKNTALLCVEKGLTPTTVIFENVLLPRLNLHIYLMSSRRPCLIAATMGHYQGHCFDPIFLKFIIWVAIRMARFQIAFQLFTSSTSG